MRLRAMAVSLVVCSLALTPALSTAKQRVKLKGYITAVPRQGTVQILDDVVHFNSGTRFEVKDAGSGRRLAAGDLAVGMLIEAEGIWGDRHQFSAQKITCELDQFDKEIKDRAYLEEGFGDAEALLTGAPTHLRVGGEILSIDESAKVEWQGDRPAMVEAAARSRPSLDLTGREVRYQGVRREDGLIAARKVELGSPRPPDAYKLSEGITVVPATDPQTGIEILEFRKGEKVQGRLKLFPVKEVQEYVVRLGQSLLPPGLRERTSAAPPQFRFYVVEDAEVNAAALPDGTVLVNTGLLGALENEAQLAFILSHEISHVTQIHNWRQVHETRTKRVLLTIAMIAGSYYVGDLGLFLGQLGLAAIWNGYERRVENQADRMALQALLDREYDPRPAVGFFRVMIERYGNRTTSAVWSNHDSAVQRGSFLTVQIERQYPRARFEGAIVDTEDFRAMREAMGPVKSL